jgi:hypothetical protein
MQDRSISDKKQGIPKVLVLGYDESLRSNLLLLRDFFFIKYSYRYISGYSLFLCSVKDLHLLPKEKIAQCIIYGDSSHQKNIYSIGAADYIKKPYEYSEIYYRINKLFQRNKYQDIHRMKNLLSTKQYKLLCLLLNKPGQLFSYKELRLFRHSCGII